MTYCNRKTNNKIPKGKWQVAMPITGQTKIKLQQQQQQQQLGIQLQN